MGARKRDCEFVVGDRLEEPRGTNLGEGVVIDTCDIDPPSSTRPFIVKFGGHVYGMNRHGALYDTLTGKNLATVTRRLRLYREFWLVTSAGKSATTTITASLSPPTSTGTVVAHMRWYEDGEVVQTEEGRDRIDGLLGTIDSERKERIRLIELLDKKDKAMGMLFARMRQNGIAYDDLLS